MLHTETRAACSDNYKKHKRAVCEHIVQLQSVKRAGTQSNRQTLNG
jgi:hypothetical protein